LSVWLRTTCSADDLEAVCCFIVNADQVHVAPEAVPEGSAHDALPAAEPSGQSAEQSIQQPAAQSTQQSTSQSAQQSTSASKNDAGANQSADAARKPAKEGGT